MKISALLVTILLAVLFILAILNTVRSYNSLQELTEIKSTVAFDPVLNPIPGYEETQQRISGMITTFKKSERGYKIWGLVLNLLVTIATGLTTLLASISTTKNSIITKSTAIAIITFTASIMSFGQGLLTTEKENVSKKMETVKKVREEMDALSETELPAQLPKINRRLDEI